MLCQQVRQRVVGADDAVEPAIGKREASHVGGGRGQAHAPAGGLTDGAGGGPGAEVGAGDAVPAQRQADGLRADAAGTVEHRLTSLTDQGVQSVPLPTDARVPV